LCTPIFPPMMVLMRPLLLVPVLGVLVASCAAAPPRPSRAPRASTPAADVVALVDQAAGRHGVPRELVLGVIQVESGFDPRSRSSVGASGLMQLMPRTAESLARRLGRERYDIDDPEFNIEAGTAYLAYLMRRFGDVQLALAAYNAGPARVGRVVAEGRELSAGARRYVAAVLAARDAFARGDSPRARSFTANVELDRSGLRRLLRQQQERYGERPDEALPEQEGAPPGSQPTSLPQAGEAGEQKTGNGERGTGNRERGTELGRDDARW
jgi:hypothetical protein